MHLQGRAVCLSASKGQRLRRRPSEFDDHLTTILRGSPGKTRKPAETRIARKSLSLVLFPRFARLLCRDQFRARITSRVRGRGFESPISTNLKTVTIFRRRSPKAAKPVQARARYSRDRPTPSRRHPELPAGRSPKSAWRRALIPPLLGRVEGP